MISSGKYDVDGREIFIGDKIAQENFNGEPYEAIYEVVIDSRDNEPALKMISGNEKAMSLGGLSAFGSEKNGRLRKGRVIDNQV